MEAVDLAACRVLETESGNLPTKLQIPASTGPSCPSICRCPSPGLTAEDGRLLLSRPPAMEPTLPAPPCRY